MYKKTRTSLYTFNLPGHRQVLETVVDSTTTVEQLKVQVEQTTGIPGQESPKCYIVGPIGFLVDAVVFDWQESVRSLL